MERSPTEGGGGGRCALITEGGRGARTKRGEEGTRGEIPTEGGRRKGSEIKTKEGRNPRDKGESDRSIPGEAAEAWLCTEWDSPAFPPKRVST